MLPEVTLVAKPLVDFNKLIGVCYQALGYSPAKAADNCHRQLSDIEKYLSILAAISDPEAPVKLDLLGHASVSFLVIADSRDAIDILQCASVASVATETIVGGIYLCILTGTLLQWREAISRPSYGNTKACFNKIATILDLNYPSRPEKTRLLSHAGAT